MHLRGPRLRPAAGHEIGPLVDIRACHRRGCLFDLHNLKLERDGAPSDALDKMLKFDPTDSSGATLAQRGKLDDDAYRTSSRTDQAVASGSY